MKLWNTTRFVALDIETSGKYPLGSEIVEVALQAYLKGKKVDEYQSLFKPSQPMVQDNIDIHGITNEMVENAPEISKHISDIHKFIGDSPIIAHHAPFDMSYLAIEFEKQNLFLPKTSGLCTSLLSLELLPGLKRHRLVNLAEHFNITQDGAHRALWDTEVAYQIFEKLLFLVPEFLDLAEDNLELDHLFQVQNGPLPWIDYSLLELDKTPHFKTMNERLTKKESFEITYQGGSRRGQWRQVAPVGLIRNPRKGDALVALTPGSPQTKRFFLDKISDVK